MHRLALAHARPTCADLASCSPPPPPPWSEGWYSEGDLDPKRGYLYIAIVYNLSILFAMLALVWFYVATKEFLA